MFIVLEGLDGAGKSTQIQMLEKYLVSQGRKVKQLHFPRFDAPIYGELIAKFLRGDFGDVNTVDPQIVALIYAGDRNDAAAMIKEAINNGYVVIADRYLYSNIAYQCSKTKSAEEKEYLRSWIINLEYKHYNIPKPDINIFLDVPFAFTEKKLSEQRGGDDRGYLNGKKDIHEESIQLQQKVRELYLEQPLLDNTFNVVPCINSMGEMDFPDDIFRKIKILVDKITS